MCHAQRDEDILHPKQRGNCSFVNGKVFAMLNCKFWEATDFALETIVGVKLSIFKVVFSVQIYAILGLKCRD